MRKILFAALVIYFPSQCMAWGLLGHRIVGQIAQTHLTTKAARAVKAILGNEDLAMCSNWPDFIKSDTSYKHLSNWHYVNLKGGLTEAQVIEQLNADTAANAYTKLNFLVAQLKDKTTDPSLKPMYLRLLVHLVGDIHQPMHVGRLDDLGGNRIRVLWFKDPYNLHQIWDEVLIDFQLLSYTEYAKAINFSTKMQCQQWQQQPREHWFYESYQLASLIYSDVKGNEDKLGFQYNFKYKALMEEQLLKGGIRLAAVLNDIFS